MNASSAPEGVRRALVVDDDDMLRLLMRELLLREGFEVIEAVNGVQGVATFLEHKPDVVMLDVMMPELDGFGACGQIRNSGLAYADRVPVLMITGLDDKESIHQAYQAGATDFITKPINWTILTYRLRYILRASQSMESLIKSEDRLADALRLAKLGNWEWNLADGSFRWSEEVFRLLGLRAEEVEPRYDLLLGSIHPGDRDEMEALMDRVMAGDENWADGDILLDTDVRVCHPDQPERTLHVRAECRRHDRTGTLQLVGTLQDVTEERNHQEQIRRLHYYDSLTDLPNRTLFTEILGQEMLQAKRYGRRLASLFVNLDKFQRINDTFGLSVGDQILKLAGERLQQVIRASDYVAYVGCEPPNATIARLGGDEFTVLLHECQEIQDAARVARRILDSLGTPFHIHEHEIFLTGSVGIAVYPNDGLDVDTFMKNGEAAMYFAKSQGRNNFQFYSQSMNASAFERLVMESNLHRAIDRGEFLLDYQPQIDARTGEVVGLEALIRWRHPELGLIPPGDFIPVAEAANLIKPIGDWALRAACAQNRAWQEAGLPKIPVAVNLSSPQFKQKDFVQHIVDILAESRLSAAYLGLEVTESLLMEDHSEVLEMLAKFRQMGVKLSVDDFGTGYSSLSYLKRFPLHTLKIDRSFVRDITVDPDDSAITGAIIALAGQLRLDVIAEGVETEDQLEALREQGCYLMQGYFFSRPLPASELPAFLRARYRTVPSPDPSGLFLPEFESRQYG